MCKITEDAATAFWTGEYFCRGNTEVSSDSGTVYMHLHGNLIAVRFGYRMLICNGGWNSCTTRARLDGIVSGVVDGIVYIRGGVMHYEDEHGKREVTDKLVEV